MTFSRRKMICSCALFLLLLGTIGCSSVNQPQEVDPDDPNAKKASCEADIININNAQCDEEGVMTCMCGFNTKKDVNDKITECEDDCKAKCGDASCVRKGPADNCVSECHCGGGDIFSEVQKKCLSLEEDCLERKENIKNSKCDGPTLTCECGFVNIPESGPLISCKNDFENSPFCKNKCGDARCHRIGPADNCEANCACGSGARFFEEEKTCLVAGKYCERMEVKIKNSICVKSILKCKCGFEEILEKGEVIRCDDNFGKSELCKHTCDLDKAICKPKEGAICEAVCSCKEDSLVLDKAKRTCITKKARCEEDLINNAQCDEAGKVTCKCGFSTKKDGNDKIIECEGTFETSKLCTDKCGTASCRRKGSDADSCDPECYCDDVVGFLSNDEKKCLTAEKKCEERQTNIPNSICEESTLKCKCNFAEIKDDKKVLIGCNDKLEDWKVCHDTCGEAQCQRIDNTCDAHCFCDPPKIISKSKKACLTKKASCEESLTIANAECNEKDEMTCKCHFKTVKDAEDKNIVECTEDIQNSQVCMETCDLNSTAICKRKDDDTCNVKCDCEGLLTLAKNNKTCISKEASCLETRDEFLNTNCSSDGKRICNCGFKDVFEGKNEIINCTEDFMKWETCQKASCHLQNAKCRAKKDSCEAECYCDDSLERSEDGKTCISKAAECLERSKYINGSDCDGSKLVCSCGFEEEKENGKLVSCKENLKGWLVCNDTCGGMECKREEAGSCDVKCYCETGLPSKNGKECLSKEESCQEKIQDVEYSECNNTTNEVQCKCGFEASYTNNVITYCKDNFTKSDICSDKCGDAHYCKRKGDLKESCEAECSCKNEFQFDDATKTCKLTDFSCSAKFKDQTVKDQTAEKYCQGKAAKCELTNSKETFFCKCNDAEKYFNYETEECEALPKPCSLAEGENRKCVNGLITSCKCDFTEVNGVCEAKTLDCSHCASNKCTSNETPEGGCQLGNLPRCICPDYSMLAPDGRSCFNLACDDLQNPCQQKCLQNETELSGYTCDCFEGFELDKDEKSCKKKDEADNCLKKCNQYSVCVKEMENDSEEKITCQCLKKSTKVGEVCKALDLCKEDKSREEGCKSKSAFCRNSDKKPFYECYCKDGEEMNSEGSKCIAKRGCMRLNNNGVTNQVGCQLQNMECQNLDKHPFFNCKDNCDTDEGKDCYTYGATCEKDVNGKPTCVCPLGFMNYQAKKTCAYPQHIYQLSLAVQQPPSQQPPKVFFYAAPPAKEDDALLKQDILDSLKVAYGSGFLNANIEKDKNDNSTEYVKYRILAFFEKDNERIARRLPEACQDTSTDICMLPPKLFINKKDPTEMIPKTVRDPCILHPCKGFEGTKCQNKDNSMEFSCRCSSEYQMVSSRLIGDQYFETCKRKVNCDSCNEETSSCYVSPITGDTECKCLPGYKADLKGSCKAICELAQCDQGTCELDDSDIRLYHCKCKAGWEGAFCDVGPKAKPTPEVFKPAVEAKPDMKVATIVGAVMAAALVLVIIVSTVCIVKLRRKVRQGNNGHNLKELSSNKGYNNHGMS